MDRHQKFDREQLRKHLHQLMQTRFQVEDISGIELMATLQRVAQLSEIVDNQPADNQELSGPRWRLMLRLFMEEEMGKKAGLTPTDLSHAQRVSKNTISALLRGLEDQGLIQREMDPNDLRVFRIQLTDAGRDLIIKTAPTRIESLNRMFSALSIEEQSELLSLLNKLHQSLMTQLCKLNPERGLN